MFGNDQSCGILFLNIEKRCNNLFTSFFSVQYAAYLYHYIKAWRKNPKWSFSCCLALVLPLTELQSEIRGLTGTNILKQQLKTGEMDMPSVSSTLKDSGLVTFELKERGTKPTRKPGKRDKRADNPSEEEEENLICEESLPVRADVHKRKRVTFDLKDQVTSQAPKARKRDKVAGNPGKKNEKNVIGHKSLTVRVDVHEPRRVTCDQQAQATNPTPKARKGYRVVDNPCKKNEENVIDHKSLTVRVDVHEPRRVPYDLKYQSTNLTPKARKYDETADELSQGNEVNVICQESFTVDVHDGGRVTSGLIEQAKNSTPKMGSLLKWLMIPARRMRKAFFVFFVSFIFLFLFFLY